MMNTLDENIKELQNMKSLIDELSSANQRFDQNILEINRKISILQSGVEKKITEITTTLNQLGSIINQLTGNA